MADRLPPLTALRAFDAAARHMSFAKAADELSVTPAALSYQIKSLEEHLGHPLFRRLNRAVELTEAGRTLAPGAADGFSRLGAAWRAAQRVVDTSTLTVTAGPAFTSKWLAPRLFAFAQDNPQIELRFAASLRRLDFARDDVDVAIRFGFPGTDGDVFMTPIIREWVTPMMHPSLAERYRDPRDLMVAPIIHDDSTVWVRPRMDWSSWFRAAGLDAVTPTGARFSQADHALDAAEAGGGVVLGRVSLADRALREGRLVAPFPLALTTDAHFRFLCPKGSEDRPQVAAFLAWVQEEVASLAEHAQDRKFVATKDLDHTASD